MDRSRPTPEPLAVNPAIGLTEAVAAPRLARDGFNDLPSAERRSIFAIVGEVIREPMFALLLGAGILLMLAAFALGTWFDGLI